MEKILIVDDDENIRKLFRVIFENDGYLVSEARDARRALSILEKEAFKVAVVDIVMPGMDGIEFTGIVREKYPDMEVVISSTMEYKDTALDALEKGASYYVTKPFKRKDLLVAVDKAKQILRLEIGSGQLDSLVALHKASKAMVSAEKIDDILSFILKVAVNTVRADGGSLMLVDEDTGELVIRTSSGMFSNKVAGKRVIPGQRVCGRAMERRASILVDESVCSQSWFRDMEKYEEIHTGMSVPMLLRDEVIGVINLKRTENTEPFTEKDVLITEILAADASVTIDKNR